MPRDQTQGRNRSDDAHGGKARRLIAGLRITSQDEAFLAVVRPFFPEAASESELAYRLWRRGLELALAEVASIGAALPPGTTEEALASLVAQRLLLTLPLLRRTGRLAMLELEASPLTVRKPAPVARPNPQAAEAIDVSASDAISGLGGSDFL